MLLPLNLSLELMQTKWKSILDPLLSDDTTAQIVIGTAQTAVGTTTSTSFAFPTFAPSVDFTANITGTYEVGGTFFIENTSANALTSIHIASTLGNPTVLFTQDAAEGQSSASANGVSVSPFLLVSLKQGTRYTFKVQMKVSSGTGQLRSDIFTSGQALIARQLS